jgi:DNA polymerase I-like protein with 3'-5' exonuclease and polymerase domains
VKNWGDEEGFIWNEPIKIKKFIQGEKAVREPLKRPPAPSDYRPPDYFPQLSRYKRLSFDLETFDPKLKEKGPGTFRKDGFVTGYGVGCEDFYEYYPVAHEGGPNCDADKVRFWLREELKEYKGEIVGAKLLYDGDWAANDNIRFPHARILDVQWAEPLLDENAKSYKLEALARKWLGEGKVTQELKDLYGPAYIENMHKLHPGHVRDYVRGDLMLPNAIIDLQMVELEKQGLTKLFDVESRLYHMLLYMRRIGVRVDMDGAEKVSKQLGKMKLDAESELRHIVGFDVNVNAGNSVAQAFESQNIVYPKTKQGNPTFQKDWLAAHPSRLAELVGMLRRVKKFQSDFVDMFLEEAIDGRIHCQFNAVKSDEYGTVSGRFSSSNPNLQQVPVRDEIFGPLIRSIFVADEGKRWWSNDYSQIEYRMLVHYAVLARCSKADIVADMYRNNPETDFHVMAAEMTGKPRKTAKNINFGIVYGMGVDHMAEVMGCDTARAKQILDEYHKEMPFCRELSKMATNKAKSGFIRTIYGRYRRFNLYEPKGFWTQDPDNEGEWIRADKYQKERPPAMPMQACIDTYGTTAVQRAFTHSALNSVLQGSAADLIKVAMVKIWDSGLVGPGAPLDCSLTVHDELNGSGDDSRAEVREAHQEVTRIMREAIPLKIPVLVGAGWGNNWSEAH